MDLQSTNADPATIYYATDVNPEAEKAWTIHGAWSHRFRNPIWGDIAVLGIAPYRCALASVLFHSNDRSPFQGDLEGKAIFSEIGKRGWEEISSALHARDCLKCPTTTWKL